MKQEILKFMVENTEGFDSWQGMNQEFEPAGSNIVIRYTDQVGKTYTTLCKYLLDWSYYPLLLTRACEGLGIFVFKGRVWWEWNTDDDMGFHFYTPDQAKEAAITVVWEERR